LRTAGLGSTGVRLLLHDDAGRAGQADVLELLAEFLIARLIRSKGWNFDAVVAPGLDLFEQGVVGFADVRAPQQQVDPVSHEGSVAVSCVERGRSPRRAAANWWICGIKTERQRPSTGQHSRRSLTRVTTLPPAAKNAGMNQFVIAMLALLLLVVSVSMAKNPEFVAHRGESHDAPENTVAAYKLAWERGDDAAETDIHLTKDGKLIVSHDPDTGRLSADKTKLVIKDHTADELRKLDMGSFKDPAFADQKLPLLDELLAIIPPGKRFFIEVKIGPEAIPELARILDRAKKAPEQTVIISFNYESCIEAKKQLPKLKTYWLVSQKQDKQTMQWKPTAAEIIEKAKNAGVDGVDVQATEPVNAEFVKAVHDAGLEFHVWTVDDRRKPSASPRWEWMESRRIGRRG
jgi:glycerophosphoryl diester phosphodiesterase